MESFWRVLLISALSAAFEGLVYSGVLGSSVGLAGTYLRIFLIVVLIVTGHNKVAAIVYLTFLGSSLNEVNFLQDQGFVTASAFINYPGFLAVRVPGLPFGWSTLLGLLILITGLQRHEKDAVLYAKLRLFLPFLAFGAAALAFSALSYLRGTFSSGAFAKDINTFLIFLFSLGPLFLNFTKREAKGIVLGLTVGTLISVSALSQIGIARQYGGSLAALSVAAHTYIFLIPLLVPRIGVLGRALIFISIVGLYIGSYFLISGKTIISLILLFSLGFLHLGGSRFGPVLRLVLLFFILAPVMFLDFNSIGTFFIEQGYVLAGYKLKQLSFVINSSELGSAIFFNSSGGNIVAETLTVGGMLLGQIPEHLALVGLGFGGQIVDHFNMLSLANADAYSQESFQSGQFSNLHLAFLNYMFWGGFAGIAFVWTITIRYILPSKEVWLTWALIMSFWIFGFGDKFDASLFALLLSAVLGGKPTLKPDRRIVAACK